MRGLDDATVAAVSLVAARLNPIQYYYNNVQRH